MKIPEICCASLDILTYFVIANEKKNREKEKKIHTHFFSVRMGLKLDHIQNSFSESDRKCMHMHILTIERRKRIREKKNSIECDPLV